MPNICMPEVGLEWVEAWALSGFVCFCFTVQSVKARALDRWEACTNSLSYYSDLYGGLTKWKWIWKNTNDHGMQNFPRKEMIFLYFTIKMSLSSFPGSVQSTGLKPVSIGPGSRKTGAATPFPGARWGWGCGYQSDFSSSSLLLTSISLPPIFHGLNF